MDTGMFEVGEVYNHKDFGRVRLKELPREDPQGARIVILGTGETGKGRTVSVKRERLSMVDQDWGPDLGKPPPQRYL